MPSTAPKKMEKDWSPPKRFVDVGMNIVLPHVLVCLEGIVEQMMLRPYLMAVYFEKTYSSQRCLNCAQVEVRQTSKLVIILDLVHADLVKTVVLTIALLKSQAFQD